MNIYAPLDELGICNYTTSAIEALTPMLEVDHIVDTAIILIVEEPTSSLFLSKKAMEEEHKSPHT